jgi:hypothetical protein
MLEQRSAALDEMHVGDITGALGTIAQNDVGPRVGWRAKIMTFFAILGPGLIVMVGDNDAGAFSTYTQAGQDYGTRLLWTLLLLIPVLYVNQEMVLRLGVVTGVGHARLILERFGAFWGVFSVLDLFVLNALTIVTEFIGISLALNYLGLPQLAGIVVAAACVMLAAAQGNFRRFERFSVALCFGPGRRARPARSGRARFLRARLAQGRPQRDHVGDHRDRRHDDRAVAAILSAELRDR